MNFDQAVSLLLSDSVEGGYSYNRNDPGGETMWGITRKVAFKNGYRGDMHALPRDVAVKIYHTEYWSEVQGDELPDRLRYPALDCAVNEGVVKAWEFLREAARAKEGEDPILCMKEVDITELVCAFIALRVRHYTSLPTWGMFGRGWANRMATNLETVSKESLI